MAKKSYTFTSLIGLLPHLAGMHYVLIPADIIKEMDGFKNTRVLISINGHEPWQGGIMALGNGNGYISIKKKLMKDYGISNNAEVKVKLQPDESIYGVPICEELQEILQQDEEGNRRFHALPLSVQRYIINYVGTVKSSQLRINKALLLIGNLKKLKEDNHSFREILGLPPREG